MYTTYCSVTGLSRPYFSYSFSITFAGSFTVSPANGEPGMICMRKKVMVASRNSVTTPTARRFAMYLNILSRLLL